MNLRIIAARYVLPISEPPINDGAVALDGARIAAVGTLEGIRTRFPAADIEDLGDAAVLPGLVNCHSHLEISSMRGALDAYEHDFSAWLLRLTELRKDLSPEDILASAALGAEEAVRAGVTCLGDIGRFGEAGLSAMLNAGLRGVLFQETSFSADDRTADADLVDLQRKIGTLREQETDLVRVGVSPHSPYTVGPKLFRGISNWASAASLPITIHAAESLSECELLQTGRGFFTEVYKKYGVEWSSPHCSPIRYLYELGILEHRPLLAHCVHVSDQDLELVRTTGSTVAHCPKSNAKFGHGYAPLEKMMDLGVTLGLGSDSVASNNVCDILDEGRFAALSARNRVGSKRFVSSDEVLLAATLGGAKALGLDDKIGSLEEGKMADLTAVSLKHPAQLPVSDVAAALVFSSNARDVFLTMVAGREIFRRPVSL